jgi:hypothetical protein
MIRRTGSKSFRLPGMAPRAPRRNIIVFLGYLLASSLLVGVLTHFM